MKKNYNLYLNIEACEILKQKRYNISEFINNLICQEVGLITEDIPNKEEYLKLVNAKLVSNIQELKKQIKNIKETKQKTKKSDFKPMLMKK